MSLGVHHFALTAGLPPPWLAAALGVALLLAGCLPNGGRPTPTPTTPPRPGAATLRVACPPPGTTDAQYCFAVREVLARSLPGVQVTATAGGEAGEHLRRIAGGEYDLGQHRQDLSYQAYLGQGPWQSQPDRQHRVLWLYALRPLILAVRADGAIASLGQLDGAPFAAGVPGTEAAALARDALRALGVAPRYAELGLEDLVAATREGRVVGFAKAQRTFDKPDGLVLRIQKTTPLRLLAFGAGDRAGIQRNRPELSWITIPANTYPETWNRAPLLTVGLDYGFAASTRLSADLAYATVRAMHEDNHAGGAGLQASAFPEVKGLDLAALSAGAVNTPFHAGALRYYRELGLAIAPAAVPPEARG